MKKIIAAVLAMICATALFAWPWSKKSSKAAEASGYTYGEEKTFHSDKPVTYSISLSDA